jgi:hypothetical protein
MCVVRLEFRCIQGCGAAVLGSEWSKKWLVGCARTMWTAHTPKGTKTVLLITHTEHITRRAPPTVAQRRRSVLSKQRVAATSWRGVSVVAGWSTRLPCTRSTQPQSQLTARPLHCSITPKAKVMGRVKKGFTQRHTFSTPVPAVPREPSLTVKKPLRGRKLHAPARVQEEKPRYPKTLKSETLMQSR